MPRAARSSEGDAVGVDGAGRQRCALMGSVAHTQELAQKCTFSVVSLSHRAGCSQVLTTHTGTAGSQLPHCGGASGVDGTLAGTFWHCVREWEGFWQGPELLPGTSHKTYIIKRTLFNKVLVGRRAGRLLCLFSFTSPRVPSAGSLKPPTLRLELPRSLPSAPRGWVPL